MRDYMRDERNPYGSRGGYISNSRPRRDRAYDDGDYYGGGRGEYYDRYDSPANREYEPSRDGYYDERNRQYRGYYGDRPFFLEQVEYPFDMRYGRDYRGEVSNRRQIGSHRGRRDYESHNMNVRELEKWQEKLYQQLDDSDKEAFKIEKIIKRASDIGIEFNKFNEDEFYTTVLMMYTDYKNTLGKGNVDVYIRMAKDFLCDEDASIKYGEKLSIYYENIVI